MQNKKFIVSHAPFWHNGSRISSRSYNTMIAAVPALLIGLFHYGAPAVGVLSISISSAMIWELLMNLISRRSITIGDGNAALIGTVFAMLLPATAPWWLVITGTFFAVVIGKEIFGGIGSNSFNPVVVALAILMVSWKDFFDFDEALLNYDFEFDNECMQNISIINKIRNNIAHTNGNMDSISKDKVNEIKLVEKMKRV